MKIVLLDRDGTVVVDPSDERVDSIEKIKLFPDAITALRKLAVNGFSVIFITNQAGIAEGRLDIDRFDQLQAKILELISSSGVNVLRTYVCPHGPDDGCVCRKPKPTMINWAAKDFDFDLSKTFMIGDRPSDIAAGKAAGTKVVQTMAATYPKVRSTDADYVAKNLSDAVDYVIAHQLD